MLINQLESDSGQSFVRMELGVPGLAPAQSAIEAEKAVLDSIRVTQYPALNGTAELREALAAYFKAFMNVEIEADNCVPTAGDAGEPGNLLAGQSVALPKKTYFWTPVFPPRCSNAVRWVSSSSASMYLMLPRASCLVRSVWPPANSPLSVFQPFKPGLELSNPTSQKASGPSDEFDCIAMEDLAYGMDFREDYSVPNQAPYPPSIRHYTDNCVLLFSGSKLFNYAGQRTGAMLASAASWTRTANT